MKKYLFLLCSLCSFDSFTQSGDLLVIGPKDWRIYVDNKFMGFTETRGFLITELTGGSHTIEVKYESTVISKVFSIIEKETVEIEISRINDTNTGELIYDQFKTGGYYLSEGYVATPRGTTLYEKRKFYVMALEFIDHNKVNFGLWYDIRSSARQRTTEELNSMFSEDLIKAEFKVLEPNKFSRIEKKYGIINIQLKILNNGNQNWEFDLKKISGIPDRIIANSIKTKIYIPGREGSFAKLAGESRREKVIYEGTTQSRAFVFNAWSNKYEEYELTIK